MAKRNPLTDPQPGDLLHAVLTKGQRRVFVIRVLSAWVEYRVGDSLKSRFMRLDHWRLEMSHAEVIHAAR